jgi:hypothetical protein
MRKEVLLFGLGMLLIVLSLGVNAQSYNYDLVNVTSRVNVTNAGPEILNLTVTNPVTLSAGGTQVVSCNATIRDWNGFNDIDVVNATLFYFENSSGPDNNDVHYTNGSCAEFSNDGVYLANYTCTFNVWYHANNGNWTCELNVNDTLSYNATEQINTTFNALFALNVTDVIDYGNLSVTDTSAEITATVTNFGNTAINVSVLGYGATEGDGLGLVCAQGSNISIEHQRFLSIASIYDDKTPLSATNQDLNITLPKPTQATIPVTEDTYWQLYVPPNPFGLCEGTVRFTATTP